MPGDEHTRPGKILLLATIAEFVVGAEPAGFGPADGSGEVVLDKGEPRQCCLPTRGQQRKEVPLASQIGNCSSVACASAGRPRACCKRASDK